MATELSPEKAPPHTYECPGCRERVRGDRHPLRCPECGARMRNLSKPRE